MAHHEAKTVTILDGFRTFLCIDHSLTLDYMYSKMYTYS